jgi:hypothetical protein
MDIFVVLYKKGEAVAQVMFRSHSLQPQLWWRSAAVVHSTWYITLHLCSLTDSNDSLLHYPQIGAIYQRQISPPTHCSPYSVTPALQVAHAVITSLCYPHLDPQQQWHRHQHMYHVVVPVVG